MPITVFDGVAKFSADSSQLDQFIVTLEQGLTTASQKAAAATQALKAAQDEFRASIKAVSADGGDTAENLNRLADAEKNLALATAAAKEEHAALKAELVGTKEAASLATEAFDEVGGHLVQMFGIMAAAEGFKMLLENTQKSVLNLQLLSEKTGIAIDTLAGIQKVSEDAGVSFDNVSAALTRLSRSQALAIENGNNQSNQQVAAFERIGISVNELKSLSPEELFYRVADAMANSKNHAEANATAFTLLGRGGAALIPIFQQNSEALREMVARAAEESGVTKEAGAAALDWEKQTSNLSEAFRAGLIPLMQAAVPAIKLVETSGSDVVMVIKDLTSIIGGLFFTAIAEMKGFGTIVDDVVHGNFSKMVGDAKAVAAEVTGNLDGIGQQFKDNWTHSTEFIKGVWTQQQPLKPAMDDLSDLTAKNKHAVQEQVAEAKAALDQQLADIEKWKAGVHLAYASGQIDVAAWKVAEIQALDASNIAHEDHLAKLVSIYQKAGDAAKAQSTQQELNALKAKDEAKATEDLAAAEEKHRQAVIKIEDEYRRLEEANIEKNFLATQKAAEELTKADDALLKTQTALAEANVAKSYKEQEEAIKQLASMHLITEEQKANQLLALYEREENDALRILQDQLKKEFTAVEAAQDKVKQAEASPFFSDAQVLELKKNLDQAEAAYLKTETEITKVQDQFDKQRMALQKDSIGQSIAMAVAGGQQLLAEQLKENQQMLIAIKAQEELAKARGQDTSALKAQEREIENTTKALQKQVQTTSTLRQAWDLFSADFKKKAKDNDSNAQEMAQSFQIAAQGLEQGLSSAFAAMVSGTESAGQAMEKAVFSTIGKLAEQWGAYYLARAIADVFDNPGAAAAEFAAGAALEALGGILSGLASLAGQSSKAGTGSTGVSTSKSTTAAETSSPNPVQVQNVQSFATGGLAWAPTLAMIGDSEGGGSAQEVVIPLENRRALDMIANALVPAIVAALPTSPRYSPEASSALLPPVAIAAASSAIERALPAASPAEDTATSKERDAQILARAIGTEIQKHVPAGGGDITVTVQSDIAQVVKEINHNVRTGRVRLVASDSIRLTRRS